MGKRGPAKKPTAVLEQRGSWLVNDRKKEPMPTHGQPDPPKWLSRGGKKHWQHLTPQLDDMGVLAFIDQDALANYCELYAQFIEVTLFTQENGVSYTLVNAKTGEKNHKQRPESAKQLTLIPQLLRYQQQFGLTPSARASLSVTKPQEKNKDDKARFFKVS